MFSTYNKRYLTLNLSNYLFYYTEKADYTFKQIKAIPLEKIKRVKALPKSNTISPAGWKFSFIIETFDRDFYFHTESQAIQNMWLNGFQALIKKKTNQPLYFDAQNQQVTLTCGRYSEYQKNNTNSQQSSSPKHKNSQLNQPDEISTQKNKKSKKKKKKHHKRDTEEYESSSLDSTNENKKTKKSKQEKSKFSKKPNKEQNFSNNSENDSSKQDNSEHIESNTNLFKTNNSIVRQSVNLHDSTKLKRKQKENSEYNGISNVPYELPKQQNKQFLDKFKNNQKIKKKKSSDVSEDSEDEDSEESIDSSSSDDNQTGNQGNIQSVLLKKKQELLKQQQGKMINQQEQKENKNTSPTFQLKKSNIINFPQIKNQNLQPETSNIGQSQLRPSFFKKDKNSTQEQIKMETQNMPTLNTNLIENIVSNITTEPTTDKKYQQQYQSQQNQEQNYYIDSISSQKKSSNDFDEDDFVLKSNYVPKEDTSKFLISDNFSSNQISQQNQFTQQNNPIIQQYQPQQEESERQQIATLQNIEKKKNTEYHDWDEEDFE